MNTEEIVALHKQYVMPTYAPGLALVRGAGSRVWDAEGKSYLDFLGGIAVISVGHCHPKLVAAITKQASTLMHTSNLFYNEMQPQLAKSIIEKFGEGKVFFCNSGCEANEGLIKLARYWGHDAGKYEVITMRNSFHGRTLATLTATGQEKVQKGFDPLPIGFRYAQFNDLESVKAAITPHTAAVLCEVIQGEGGVCPADPEFIVGLRKLCDQAGVLLMIDEIQTGVGRLGTWFGFQSYGIKPDAFSLAKGLGGGFPIGALVANAKLQDTFKAGAHGSTFGGTPLATATALAVLNIMEEENLLANAAARGEQFRNGLNALATKYAWMVGARGRGLMTGLVLNQPAKQLEQLMTAKGMLSITTSDKVIRMLPPLTITAAEVDEALSIIAAAAAEFKPAA